MIHYTISKITTYIEKNSDIKNTQRLEEINYALQAIFNETFKIIILVIAFLIVGKLNYLLFSMFILCSIRGRANISDKTHAKELNG